MPGIHVVRGDVPSVPDVVDPALDAVCFRADYESDRERRADGTVLGHTGYDDYPVRRVEAADATVVLEGHLYDVDDVPAQLRHVAGHLAAGRHEAVTEWLCDRDGDFLVAVHADDAVYLLNDLFARLPVYYATVAGSVVVSRELKFLRELAFRAGSPVGIDRLAAAQKLLFGYCLGDRTLFEGVRVVPPASVVRVDDGVRVHRLFEHDFDAKAFADRSVEANADAIAARLAAACENRSRDGVADVVSLSGGLDSRTVAAAYVDAGVPVTTATYNHGGGEPTADVRAARSVADALDLDWTVYDASPSTRHNRRILDVKQGMNYVGMAFILDFFEQLRADHGELTYVTGDGGDKVLADVTPARSLSSMEELVEYVVAANGRIPVAEAAAVANVDERDLLASVEARLASYPESTLDGRYVHFLVRERAINCLNHGEDRNRYYFWSASPFYSWPVFRYAMNCPDAQKRRRRLHSALLDRFAPGLVDVEYPNFGAALPSMEYRVKRFAFDLLSRYPRVKERVVDLLVGDDGGDDVVARLETQLSRADLRPLSPEAVAAVVADADSYRLSDLQFLYTVTSMAEKASAPADVDAEKPAIRA